MSKGMGNFSGRIMWTAFIGVACGAIALPYWQAGAQVQRPGLPPVAAFDWSFCPSYDEPVIFDASLSSDADGEIVRYIWDFGDGETAEGVIIEHKYEQEGAYIVKLTVVDNDALANDVRHHLAVDDQCREVLRQGAPDRLAAPA